MLQLLAGGIQQQDAEHLKIDQAPQKFRDPSQQFVQVQDRGQLARDLIEQQQNSRLLRGARIELGIFNACRHARGNQGQQPLVLFGEIVFMPCLQVDHANHPVLGGKRHRQLRAHVRHGSDVSGILRDIVDQNRLSKLNCLPRDAFADFDSGAFSELLRISNLKTETQLLSLLVQEQNGEDFVVDDLAHDLSDATQSGIQIERRRHHVGYL